MSTRGSSGSPPSSPACVSRCPAGRARRSRGSWSGAPSSAFAGPGSAGGRIARARAGPPPHRRVRLRRRGAGDDRHGPRRRLPGAQPAPRPSRRRATRVARGLALYATFLATGGTRTGRGPSACSARRRPCPTRCTTSRPPGWWPWARASRLDPGPLERRAPPLRRGGRHPPRELHGNDVGERQRRPLRPGVAVPARRPQGDVAPAARPHAARAGPGEPAERRVPARRLLLPHDGPGRRRSRDGAPPSRGGAVARAVEPVRLPADLGPRRAARHRALHRRGPRGRGAAHVPLAPGGAPARPVRAGGHRSSGWTPVRGGGSPSPRADPTAPPTSRGSACTPGRSSASGHVGGTLSRSCCGPGRRPRPRSRRRRARSPSARRPPWPRRTCRSTP